MNIFKKIGFAVFILIVSSCATVEKNIPGNWEQIGTISNENIKVAIDKDSIKKNGHLVSFRDKKTVVNPKHERYVNTVRYKIAQADWEINCRNKTFRIKTVNLYDSNNRIIQSEQYNAVDIRPMPIVRNTINEKQFAMVCR